MKYILFVMTMVLSAGASAQQMRYAVDTAWKSEPIYNYVEQMPVPLFELDAYLQSNLHYPAGAEVEGRVIVQFVVTKYGTVENVKVTRGIGSGCDEEAARVVKSMPAWKPGKQNGKDVNVYYTLPVSFVMH